MAGLSLHPTRLGLVEAFQQSAVDSVALRTIAGSGSILD